MRWGNTRESIQTALAWGELQHSSGMVEKALYGCMIDKSNVNHDNMIVANLEAAKICAAISSQPPLIRAWLRFCYGPRDNIHDQAEVAMGVMWFHFPKCGAKLWQKYVRLCEIAALDYKCRVIAGKPLPRGVYLTHVHVDSGNWLRSGWQHRLNQCLDTLSQYDSKGLAHVAPIVASLR